MELVFQVEVERCNNLVVTDVDEADQASFKKHVIDDGPKSRMRHKNKVIGGQETSLN